MANKCDGHNAHFDKTKEEAKKLIQSPIISISLAFFLCFFSLYISPSLSIMAQNFPLVPKPLGGASDDPLKRVSLIPRVPEHKVPENVGERRPLAPRTGEEKPFGEEEGHHLAPKPPSHEIEKLSDVVPKSVRPHESEDGLPKQSLIFPKPLGQRLGLGKKAPFQRGGRPMFALSDDRVMLEKVSKTHSPDMLSFDVISLLSIVHDIFKSHVPSLDRSPSKAPLVFKDYADYTSFEAFAELIDQISCEIECKCMHGGESQGLMSSGFHLDSRHTAAFSVLSLISKYRWDAKAVLVLAALAVKYGVFLLLAETYATNQLTKSLAMIKQIPGISSQETSFNKRLEKSRVLMQDMVDLTTTIIKIYELPPHYITEAFTGHVPIAVYWIVRSVLLCTSQISCVSGFRQDQVMSFMEVSEVHENSERLRKINAYLTEQLNKSLDSIKEKKTEDEYQELIRIFTTMIHIDIVLPLLRLFRSIDFLYHGSGHSKRRVGIDALSQKNVLLLISDLENLEREMYILEQLYNDAWQQSFEILWVPIQDHWTESDKTKYETLHSGMKWYVLGEPWMLSAASLRFIKEWWGFKTKPILVALDPKGQVVSTNAFPMIWIWQTFAHPFTNSRERDLWAEQEWNLEFLIDGTDPHSLTQMAEGKFICLYGGEDMQWIRNFTNLWRGISKAADIQLEMVYVGKRNPKNGLQPIIDRIREERISHTLVDIFQIWFFWTRIESMWESKQRVLKQRTTRKEEREDIVLQEITSLLGYGGEGGGWGLVSRASELMVRAKGNVFEIALTEFDQWSGEIPSKGFLRALYDHLMARRPPHHCTRFMLPESSGIIPNSVECTECRRTMDKFYLFQCCLE
ncbi:PREDICTED: protein SIEVE ELEMENT OCCLUSION A [Tarenaya hassleriana]|uniref:protein SIEVE ELEMENT OCCLUSION A n=1 Tax=Tarenaya hassleriana TaxID=28532 RepID=UPI0008FD10C2|nr:PREDICTED: protein SIEVE ELEMENT OCCLUSION A [Tarenaya hassleriana]